MKRKIEFRGKRTDNGEWVYGSYVSIAGTHKIYSFSPTSPSAATWYEVDLQTVSQFIDYDSDGTPLYEGDYVQLGRGPIYRLYWNEDAKAFYASTDGFRETGEISINDVADFGFIRIHPFIKVGNMYDNPEFGKWQ